MEKNKIKSSRLAAVFQSPYDPGYLSLLPEEKRNELLEKEKIMQAEFEKEQKELQSIQLASIPLEAGSQELKFFLQKEIQPIDGNEFEFSFVAPLCNFSMSQGSSEMSVMVVLPKGHS
ncbi:hypothetical protein [Metabacillus idriensis]|uniref:hypothetical protein n=1 Tax=Metabacillus idriensis TaxID=324768 RepID=UPI001748F014|nr:hypothetical protein [Metabacillus idriensis]